MISVTSKSIDFAGKNLVSCGCSSNANTVRSYAAKVNSKVWGRRGGGHGAANFVCCKSRTTQCRVSSMKTAEPTLNGGTQAIQGIPTGLNLKSYSETPISPSKLFEVVADDLQTLNKNLQSIVGAENPVLMSAAEQIFSAGGKRMRPALVFLVSRATAELLGLKDLTVKHRRLAEIIEMIHTASLIHDDVLDESDLRRGKPVIKDFASGEIKQASSLFDCDVELDEYLIKSYYKTASLIAASTKGAAIFSGADSSITEKMYEYGKNLGLSFQVVDDILDFTQSAEQLGKPAGTDLAKGNLTAPVIFALEKEPKLRDIIESEFSETSSLDEAIKLVKSCGGIERARELAKEKADLAIQSLQCLPPSMFRLALEDMVAYNLQRIA
ncbi:sporulation-specific protein 2 [Stylosanthes scabra]|uniref:Sporulation-specific protein 2 n=1 Tax=Stylosanthes scabra TaxID=79078 RepID=A0ABU6R2X2_9FABA|nr:sporulation-specific protein 2 [Stylosanthes scabra]